MASHKISRAIAGSIHTPSMLPPLRVTPAEIAESALGAAVAGAKVQQAAQVGDTIEDLGSSSQLAEVREISRARGAAAITLPSSPQHTVR